MAAKCRGQDWSRPPGPHRPREWGIMVRNHHVPPDTSLQTDRFEPGGRPGWDTQPKVAALDTHTLDRIGERLVTSPLTTNPPYEPGHDGEATSPGQNENWWLARRSRKGVDGCARKLAGSSRWKSGAGQATHNNER